MAIIIGLLELIMLTQCQHMIVCGINFLQQQANHDKIVFWPIQYVGVLKVIIYIDFPASI